MKLSEAKQILNLKGALTEKEIKESYRKLAKQYHPDLNKGDAEAQERFVKLNDAYNLLMSADIGDLVILEFDSIFDIVVG